MVLAKVLLLTIFFSESAFGKLNPLITKQDVGRMRYLSEDGSLSIFQRRNGELSLSTNYAVDAILKGPPLTNYLVTASPNKKYFIIEKDENYLRSHSIRREREIYKIIAGGKTPDFIGKGIASKLHYQDTWASFYRPYQKKIVIKSLVNKILDFEILIKNPNSEYFIPEILFVDNNRVLYSDVNELGQIALFLFSRESKKVEIVYKAEEAGKYLEMCKMKDKLYLGEFAYHGVELESRILEFSLNKKLDYAKGRIIYESPKRDLGNMICFEKEERVYFVKAFYEEENFYNLKSDVVFVDPKKLVLKRISTIGDVTHIIEMDQRILAPHEGEFLIVAGDPLKDDSLD